jgi:hypothetical protein
MCLLHQLDTGSLVFLDSLGSFGEIHAAVEGDLGMIHLSILQ